MANLPEGLAQFEYHKMQLISSLGSLAESMRNCANLAENFAQLVGQVPYGQLPANGQFTLPAFAAPLPVARGKRKAGEEADGRKAKRVKKPKDPNAPKRPPSSYLLFQNEVRQELKDKNPSLPNNELLSLIAKMWKEMPKEQKDTYEARQRLAKEEWIVNRTAYKTSLENQEQHTPSESPIAETHATHSPPVESDESEGSSSAEEDNSQSDSSDSERTRKARKSHSKTHSEKKSKKKA